MIHFFTREISRSRQYIYSLITVFSVSAGCYTLSHYIGYRVVAFLLLLTVSFIAMLFDILPVLVTAVFTALIWDFFFIPPHFTLRVRETEDMTLLMMYLVIAMINAALTFKVRQAEKVAREREEKANAVKLYNTMLNSLSHELRTPIATIIGATDNLQNNNARLTQQNRHDLVGEIAQASLRLNQQVENLLNMSRLESGFIEPKKNWCDVNELVYDVVKMVEENKVSQKIAINVNPDLPLFKLDEGMLLQIVYSLLSNATLYTPAESRIDVVATCYADVLHIIITDDGQGFPEEEINSVFDKFYRLKNSKAGGTGLGLSIVRGFAEAMGGTVQLENIQPHGAQFTVRIPAETSYLKNLKNE